MFTMLALLALCAFALLYPFLKVAQFLFRKVEDENQRNGKILIFTVACPLVWYAIFRTSGMVHAAAIRGGASAAVWQAADPLLRNVWATLMLIYIFCLLAEPFIFLHGCTESSPTKSSKSSSCQNESAAPNGNGFNLQNAVNEAYWNGYWDGFVG